MVGQKNGVVDIHVSKRNKKNRRVIQKTVKNHHKSIIPFYMFILGRFLFIAASKNAISNKHACRNAIVHFSQLESQLYKCRLSSRYSRKWLVQERLVDAQTHCSAFLPTQDWYSLSTNSCKTMCQLRLQRIQDSSEAHKWTVPTRTLRL